MIRVLQTTLSVIFCAGLLSHSANAAEVIAPKYVRGAFEWQIVESPEMLPQPVWVDNFQTFLEVKLFPKSLYITKFPIMSSEGIELVPSDSQLISFTGAIEGVCTTNPLGEVKRSLFINMRVATNICFIDTDGDTQFDQYFSWAGNLIGSMVVQKRRNTVKPFALEKSDPRQFKSPLPLYLQYDYFAGAVDRLSFSLCMSKNVKRTINGSMPNCLSGPAEVQRSRVPASFEVFGGRFLVKEKREAQLLIEQQAPFQPQPIVIH